MKATDLTLLAWKNGGKYPAARVEPMLGGSDKAPVHGTKQMPVWGPAFRDTRGGGKTAVGRVTALSAWLESMQARRPRPRKEDPVE
jgi:hypothetical protein